jgi:dipeptidyl aminopeptidase/acylaminoacyl peptidase
MNRVRHCAASLVVGLATLILVSVSTAQSRFGVDDMLDVVDVQIADLSEDGRWLVATATTLRDRIGVDNHRYGDPTYVAPQLFHVWIVDTQLGDLKSLYSEKKQVTGFKWDRDGRRLAFFVLQNGEFKATLWDREQERLSAIEIPENRAVDESAEIRWSPDGNRLYLTLRSSDWHSKTRERFEALTSGPIVVLSSDNPILAWDDLRRLGRHRSLAVYDVPKGPARELLSQRYLSSYAVTEDGMSLIYAEDKTEKTGYDIIFGSDNEVAIMPAGGGESRVLIETIEGDYGGPRVTWSRDNGHFAYADDGKIYFGSIEDDRPRQLTGKTDDEEENDPTEDKDESEDAGLSPVSLSPRGRQLVASNKKGLWLVETETGAKELFIEMSEDDKEGDTYEILDWSPDGGVVYLSYRSQTEWERGLARYSLMEKKLDSVYKDSRLLRDVQLSRDGSTLVFRAADGNHPYDIYVADSEFQYVRRLTTTNPQLNSEDLARTELISYLDVDGDRLYGVVYYPPDYEEGKRYPTVFNVYEDYFDDTYNGTVNVLTAQGYVVVRPSVDLERGYPGEAWLKGVTAAANKLIEMGVADGDRLGVHGTSYGGYAVNLLITQTDRFKAAINISGKVNMVSFYTDSPRLGIRNIHAPEKSQDRIGSTLWEQPQKYIQHSAIMFADRIDTPLLLMTGEQDHNVPGRQAMEMYYALRRLGKDVAWVNYINGGHGMPRSTVEEVEDYHRRILDWYEKYLKENNEEKK